LPTRRDRSGTSAAASNAEEFCFRTVLGISEDLARPRWQLCNASDIPPASVVDFCVRDWTDCRASVVDTVQCNQVIPIYAPI
jgi:hypothetical protein